MKPKQLLSWTKQLLCGLSELALVGLFILALFFIYVVAGIIIGAPYVLLAGYNVDALCIAVLVSPILICALFFLWQIHRVAVTRRLKNNPWKLMFWSFGVYLLLPIFLNWISIILTALGFQSVGCHLHTFRYVSLVLLPMVALVGLFSFGMILAIREDIGARKNNSTPPSSPGQPPTTKEQSINEMPTKDDQNKGDIFQAISLCCQ